uniref:Myb/SANT-like DNA-binding domain-containing protein n=1 Tax=Timema shepardi TaxID=629360 RepID=A0A7R9FY98_TIMSH|nr:unnamed protein product [Timema shepardi]
MEWYRSTPPFLTARATIARKRLVGNYKYSKYFLPLTDYIGSMYLVDLSFPDLSSDKQSTAIPLSEKFIWDRNMVYALIEEYKKRVSEFENPSYKKRRLWSKIAHAMRVRGFKMMTDEMCDIKWRNLKKTFKEIYFGKRSTVKWEYYNVLKHIFEKDMSFYSNFGAARRRPILSKKTLNKKTLAEEMELEPDSSNSYIIDDSLEGLEEGEISANETKTVSNHLYQHSSQQPPPWFLEFLQVYQKDEEKRIDMIQKMHSDIIAIEGKKCELLKMLITKLSPVDFREGSSTQSVSIENYKPEPNM